MAFLSYCIRGDNTLCNLRTSQRVSGFDLRWRNLVLLVSRAAVASCHAWSVNDKGYIAPLGSDGETVLFFHEVSSACTVLL